MFERRTVFVVGAGGSKELGLPMGSELTTSIAARVSFTFPDGYNPKGGDLDIYNAIKLRTRQLGESDSNPFYRAGHAITRGMSQAISIDNFLHTHADNEKITFMGKLGIVSAILEAERKSKIAIRKDGDKLLDFTQIDESWHTVFCKMLLEGSSRSDLSHIFDSVKFITFNYDRCIERYVTHSLRSYLGLAQREAEELAAKLEIIHPYGQVGRLPVSTERDGIAFGESVHHSQLPEVAAQIKTFTERIENDEMVERMHRVLAEAEVVVYLGFSYGDMNMELMTLKHAGERVIYGTSLGISAPNQQVIERDIISAMGPNRDVVRHTELADLTCKDFLYAYWKPIVRGV